MLVVVVAVVLVASAAAESPEDTVIRPGVPMFDTAGNRMYAGGANIWFENGTFWLVGEVKYILKKHILYIIMVLFYAETESYSHYNVCLQPSDRELNCMVWLT